MQIFEDVKILAFGRREDTMEVTVDTAAMAGQGISFVCREQRIYHMPRKGTFYGIHFQTNAHPQAKLIYLLSGRGMDYVVDLRRESPTYRKWIVLELRGGDNRHVYIPQGYGHAFLSLEDNTTQLFTTDEHFYPGESKKIRYDDPKIGLSLPVEITAMSEGDRRAPCLDEIEFEV